MFYKLLNILEVKADCGMLSEGLVEIIQYLFYAIRYAVPALLVVLIMKDFISAVAAGKEEDMKQAQGLAIKRLIIGVVIFLVPTLVKIILNIAGFPTDLCGLD